MTSFPSNFIPIEDAFDQAFDALAPVHIVRWAKAPIEEDFAELDQAKLDEFDEAKRKVERLFRDALADGLIKAWVKEGGRMEVLIERESWRPMALGAPGFEPRTHHLVNPGPNDERPVAVERGHFEIWLRMTAGQGASYRRGRPEAADWGLVEGLLHEKCDKEGGVPCPDNPKGWRTQADAMRYTRDDILRSRREKVEDTALKGRVREMLRNYAKKSGTVTN
jgi:hypothetical protein